MFRLPKILLVSFVALFACLMLIATPAAHAAGASATTAGINHSCALTLAGGVQCWGINSEGELGDGTTTNRSTPVAVSGLSSGVQAIAAGANHTCALTTAGAVQCWGYNGYGELGDGTTTNRLTPVAVSGLSSGVKAITAGNYHTCALTTAGAVQCWGENANGELGDGTVVQKLTPVAVSGLSSGVQAITTGVYHSCALTTTGGVQCWGYNIYGQLGDGTTTDHYTPAGVSGLSSGVQAIAAGGLHTCALTTTGGMQCWGYNNYGELGDGTITSRTTPVAVSGLSSGVKAIAASVYYSCALTTTGGAQCWGYNNYGELGDGTTLNRSTPVAVSGLSSGVQTLATGRDHVCAVTTVGAVKCWGLNSSGQLGDGTITNRTTPLSVVGFSGRQLLALGDYHSCGLTSAGGVQCWGYNSNGQVGDGTTLNRISPVAVIGLSSGVQDISAGVNNSCALTTAGAVKCWGSNNGGQLGDGTTTDSSTPVTVSGLSSGVQAVSMGASYACALTTAGGVQCWGGNGYGNLGDGTTTNRLTPVAVSGLSSGVQAITAGSLHACALTTAGGVKCWGYNGEGGLGNGTTTNSSTPVTVSGLSSGVQAIAAAAYYTCALTTAGAVQCWGRNTKGQLGDGTTTNRSTPVAVSGLSSGVQAIAGGGGGFKCALSTLGGVNCWGFNTSGQLGDGTTTNRSTPVLVSGLSSGVLAVTTGGAHTCALTTGGVKCWGYNAYGQLGDGTLTQRLTPVATRLWAQNITVTTAAPASAAYNATFPVAATSSSGLAVAITISGGCSIAGNTVTMTSGTNACTVMYDQSGDSNYYAATEVFSSTSATKIAQTISVTSAAPSAAVNGAQFGVSATSSSSLAVAITTGGGCSGSGSGSATITQTSSTVNCVVYYDQVGDLNYNAASQVSSTTIAAGGQDLCTPGNYWNGATCVNASAGYYVPGAQAAFQIACAAGTYQPSTGQSSCINVSAGYYASSVGSATAQIACPAGTYNSNPGATSIVACLNTPAGNYSAAGSATPTQCPAGTFNQNTNATSISACQLTLPGGYSLAGSTLPTPCAAGTYQPNSGASSCINASAGFYVAGTQATSQTSCAFGYYQPATGSTSCLQVSAGYYASSVGSATAQIACPAGTYNPNPGAPGIASCLNTPAGNYSAAGSAAPTQCPAGTFNQNTNATSISACQQTLPGGYSLAGSTIPTACAAGTYQPLAGQSSCIDAAAGYYVAGTAATTQTSCALGYYQPATGSTSCLQVSAGYYASSFGSATAQVACPAGTYNPNPGAPGIASCLNTPAGNYSAAASSAPTQCPAGTFNQYTNATNISNCQQTLPGGYSLAGSTLPTACSAGTYQPNAGASSCIDAAAGYYVSGTAATMQTVCAAGTYQPLTGQSSCNAATACTLGSTFETVAPTTTADRVCTAVSTCSGSQYESSAPTLTSNRVCSALTTCGANEYESTAPTATTNRVCSAVTMCTAGEYETAAPTATTNRTCAALTTCGANEYESTAPTATTNRVCSAVTTCTASEYETAAPTATTNRTCAALTTCTAGQYESTTPTTTTNRVCSAYTAQHCATYAANVDACTTCQSGYHLVGGVCALPVKNDFGGDGKADVLLRNTNNGQWYMAELNGVSVQSQGVVGALSDINQPVVATGDFDGDGKADILTRGTAAGLLPGTFRLELASGQVITSAAWMTTMSTSLNDVVMSTKDFNKDGKADVLLRNSVTGVWTINYMNGINPPTIGTLNASTDLCYTMQGDGDYDGNGYPDLLLRRDACGGASYPWLVQTLQGGFTVLATGSAGDPSAPTRLSMNTTWGALVTDKDFNGDGKDDVLMRALSGSVEQWLLSDMNGVNAPSASGLLPVPTQSMWQLAADADFNGDGKADLLLRSTATGQWVGYLLNGRTINQTMALDIPINLIWSLRAIEDFNGDADSDVLIRNNAGGQWYLETMNGLTVQSKGALVLTYDLGYTLQND